MRPSSTCVRHLAAGAVATVALAGAVAARGPHRLGGYELHLEDVVRLDEWALPSGPKGRGSLVLSPAEGLEYAVVRVRAIRLDAGSGPLELEGIRARDENGETHESVVTGGRLETDVRLLEFPFEVAPGTRLASFEVAGLRFALLAGEHREDPSSTAAPPRPSLAIEGCAGTDWSAWAAEAERVVRERWTAPEEARRGLAGAVTAHFFVRPDGGVEDVAVRRARGPEALARAAAEALEARLPELPADCHEPRVGVTWSFFYNLDADEVRDWVDAGRDARTRP